LHNERHVLQRKKLRQVLAAPALVVVQNPGLAADAVGRFEESSYLRGLTAH
jgi:hypothetical protein